VSKIKGVRGVTVVADTTELGHMEVIPEKEVDGGSVRVWVMAHLDVGCDELLRSLSFLIYYFRCNQQRDVNDEKYRFWITSEIINQK
jgi:hypothetical protein